jgi:uncharacterized phiE125 gp8 family phage protein
MTTNVISVIEQPIDVATARRRAKLDDNGDDLDLQVLIAGVADQAGQETGRSIALTEWELTLDAFPAGEIMLLWPPIVSVVSVKYIDPAGMLQTLPEAQYVLDTRTPPGWVLAAQGTAWPATADAANAVTVTYRAGYGLACPEAVKLWICAYLAAHYRYGEAVGTKLERLPHVDGLLDRYRLWRV